MNNNDNDDLAIKEALIGAVQVSSIATCEIAGDIPTLLCHAYSLNFREQIPSIRNDGGIIYKSRGYTPEDLLTMLSELSPLKPTAQALLDHARSILTNGPPLSMNVELADGEELPVALHTLLQGTLWAILLQAGADPDLTRTKKQADVYSISYTDADKHFWFLCKKFFFSLNVAEKDGEGSDGWNHSRLYAGRLFNIPPRSLRSKKLSRVAVPSIVRLYGLGSEVQVMVTPHGVYGLEQSTRTIQFNEAERMNVRMNELVLDVRRFMPERPARVSFAHCPEVAKFEASLPPWQKDRLVVDSWYDGYLLLTPVGIVAIGDVAKQLAGPSSFTHNKKMYRPIALPHGFHPDSAMVEFDAVILTMGRRCVISGRNDHGQLGIGTKQPATSFTTFRYHVDRFLCNYDFNLFFAERCALIAGLLPVFIAQSGLLPGHLAGEELLVPYPLCFRRDTTRFYCDSAFIAHVSSNETSFALEMFASGNLRFFNRTVPFEAVEGAISAFDLVVYLKTDRNEWVKIDLDDRYERMVIVDEPEDCKPFKLIEVDLPAQLSVLLTY
ncbi:hypothetical protein J8273_5560 [Carpediemonas membranifera]|uniref:Uncharacterized protein n=1 Tax=Carpediemonas membranifera TaxID=201153 RepID=A0A8J6AU58_9EUKA|nr:hypothetical protein J8273_5560 [Carpediemonas membranifera]|eukprot:KAG9392555.1 hypothetical protein J8273_5560 [Carpediemonas membranifera]